MAITSNPTIRNGAVITAQGTKSYFNMTAATLVKTGTGRVARINVLIAGSGTGSVFDAATIGTAATANQIAVIPATVGTYDIDFPVSNGIVLAPGTGQTLVISYI